MGGMDMRTRATQQRSADIYNGQSQVVMIGGSIEPEVGLQIHLQVLDAKYVEEHQEDVAASIGAYVAGLIAEAAGMGVPIRLPPGGDPDA